MSCTALCDAIDHHQPSFRNGHFHFGGLTYNAEIYFTEIGQHQLNSIHATDLFFRTGGKYYIVTEPGLVIIIQEGSDQAYEAAAGIITAQSIEFAVFHPRFKRVTGI